MVGVIHLFRRLRHCLKLSHARNTRVADATEGAAESQFQVRFYGNVGNRERLNVSALGSAVNGASRIAAMCRSIVESIVSLAVFANVGDIKRRLVSVGRDALGVLLPRSCSRSMLMSEWRPLLGLSPLANFAIGLIRPSTHFSLRVSHDSRSG
jgi:hypothetical protein